MEGQITWQDLDTSFGKMCQELSRATGEKTSVRSSRKSPGSPSRKPPMCLCLKRDGLNPDASTMRWEDGVLLGEFTMHSFGEYPREENASLLSQILEDSPHQKYYLSEKACLGILKRAERRGKELPPELKAALLAQSRSRSDAENLGGGKGILIQEERTGALSTLNNQSVFAAVDVRNLNETEECSGTLQSKNNGGYSLNYQNPIRLKQTVRRLTPLECERLQGYPDGWTLIGEPCEVEIKDYQIVLAPGKDCAYQTESDAFWAWEESVARDSDGEPIETFDAKKFGFIEKKVQVGSHKETRHFYRDEKGRKRECSDTARHKALGNSIALPFWFWLLRRISAQYERPAYLGSLFDGIGGFPLCWERCNGKGTALWASEIEEFPMAVTKYRFGGE